MTSRELLTLGALLVSVVSVVAQAGSNSSTTAPPPPQLKLLDLVKEQTFEHHTGREFAAIYNVTDATNSSTNTGPSTERAGDSSALQQGVEQLINVPVQAPGNAPAGGASKPSTAPNVSVSWTGNASSADTPANQSTPAKEASAPEDVYEVYTVDGEPIVVQTADGRPVYTDTWAIPAAIILLLAICAGIGIFVVYRRRRAAQYYGLREAEMGQVHRNI